MQTDTPRARRPPCYFLSHSLRTGTCPTGGASLRLPRGHHLFGHGWSIKKSNKSKARSREPHAVCHIQCLLWRGKYKELHSGSVFSLQHAGFINTADWGFVVLERFSNTQPQTFCVWQCIPEGCWGPWQLHYIVMYCCKCLNAFTAKPAKLQSNVIPYKLWKEERK